MIWCLPKTSACNVMHEQVRCHDEAANHQLPTAVAFWIIQIIFTEEFSSLMQNWMQICCSNRSVILNVMATQYTCSLHCVYCSHWVMQLTPVHSLWLPVYIDVTQTVLVISTTIGVFADRPYICPSMYRFTNFKKMNNIIVMKNKDYIYLSSLYFPPHRK